MYRLKNLKLVGMGKRGRGWEKSIPVTERIFSFLKIYFIIYFSFGCVGSLLLRAGFSLVAESRGYSSLRCAGFSLRWLLLLWSTGSRRVGFSSCGTWAQ